jgi:hypothetical protein
VLAHDHNGAIFVLGNDIGYSRGVFSWSPQKTVSKIVFSYPAKICAWANRRDQTRPVTIAQSLSLGYVKFAAEYSATRLDQEHRKWGIPKCFWNDVMTLPLLHWAR